MSFSDFVVTSKSVPLKSNRSYSFRIAFVKDNGEVVSGNAGEIK